MDYAQQNRPERGLGAHERERRSRARPEVGNEYLIRWASSHS